MSVRPAEIDDADRLVPDLRDDDLQEIRSNLGEGPLTVLRRGIALSRPCYTVESGEGRPLAVFGVVPDSRRPDVGLVWLLGSHDLAKDPFYFLRNSRTWVERLHQDYRVLWNHVDARNMVHIRWLEWAGFTILRRIERFGVEQRPFYEFESVRGCDVNTIQHQDLKRFGTPHHRRADRSW